MKQQVILIHGGFTFDTYEEYLQSLIDSSVTPEKFKTSRHWQDTLHKEFDADFEVFTPRMPNRNNARYHEWCIWFEKMLPFINDNVILVGYSLGGVFLAKYISENSFPKRIKALILVATPLDTIGLTESVGDFAFRVPTSDFSVQTGSTYLVFSEDDPAVPFERVAEYKKVLSNCHAVTFSNRGHFYQETFPELVELIQTFK
jgi:uncharacterized protein